MKKLKQGGGLRRTNIFRVKQAGRFFVASEVEEVEKAATCCSAWNFFMVQIKCAYFLVFHLNIIFKLNFII